MVTTVSSFQLNNLNKCLWLVTINYDIGSATEVWWFSIRKLKSMKYGDIFDQFWWIIFHFFHCSVRFADILCLVYIQLTIWPVDDPWYRAYNIFITISIDTSTTPLYLLRKHEHFLVEGTSAEGAFILCVEGPFSRALTYSPTPLKPVLEMECKGIIWLRLKLWGGWGWF